MDKLKPESVDEYIRQFPDTVQAILIKLRQAVTEAAGGADEKISYSMPAFYKNGILVYFAAQKKHIGFYPTASGIEAFKNELSEYKSSKGAVQFPYNKPIPYELVKKIVRFRADENAGKLK